MITPLTEAQFEAAQAEFREMARSASSPEPKNVNLAANLNGDTFLEYRGRNYRVPPVPYKPGIKMQAIYLLIENLSKLSDEEQNSEAAQQALLGFLDELSEIFKTLIIPTHPLDRLFWRWYKNPFSYASNREMMELLSFFSSCRTSSSVRLRESSVLAPSPHLSTMLTSSGFTSDTTGTKSGG